MRDLSNINNRISFATEITLQCICFRSLVTRVLVSGSSVADSHLQSSEFSHCDPFHHNWHDDNLVTLIPRLRTSTDDCGQKKGDFY